MNRGELVKVMRSNFSVKELVCPHIYARFGETAWDFLDLRLLEVLWWVRTALARPITVNNTRFKERGMRCNMCNEVKSKDHAYLSAHVLGQGVDFDVQGMTATEVRKWIDDHRDQLPHKIRLEKKCNGEECRWVHLDVRNETAEKIVYFNG